MSTTIYACGGAGINIGRQVAGISSEFSEHDVYFIDTSESNLRMGGINSDNVFLFEGIDGSGKVRAENHKTIAKSVLKILEEMKPGKFNIIVNSASGGSGSVIGHSILAELKKRGEQVVMILIGSTASHIEIENTTKTLKSLDALADKVGTPVVMHYLENTAQHARSAIDAAAIGAVTMLLALFAGVHDEMDSADLKTWMNHSSLGTEAVSLQFAYSNEDYANAKDVMSVATLAQHGMNTILEPVPAYQTVGFVPATWTEGSNKLIKDKAIHFMLSSEIVEKVSVSLNERLKAVNAELASRVKRDSMADGDSDTGDGLFL